MQRKLLGQILKEMGLLTEGRLQEALALQRRKGGLLGEILVGMGVLQRPSLLLALGRQAGMEVVDLAGAEIPPDVIAAVDPSTATLYRLVPFRREGGVLTVAMADPMNAAALDDLRFVLGQEVHGAVAPEDQVVRALQRYYADGVEGARRALREEAGRPGPAALDLTKVDLSDREAMAKSPPIVRLLNYILFQAIRDRASDVHLEPFEKDFKVRYRIDGILYDLEAPAKGLAEALISRVKVMADLDIAETRVPQDGRIELSIGGRPVDLRVSTLPTMFGESCVLRILDRSNVSLDLERLGVRERDLRVLRALMEKPHGIILVTGPTGSGKTTTLYSILQEANDVGVKLITTEDPVEYDLEGVVQVQVNEEIGLTYASCLRSILRQDPDVILVGEVRDFETAQIAVEAALTGHLVFSTLHTNDAPSAVTRMVDIGVEPYLLAATLEAVVAQRLVRRLCPACRTGYDPTPEVLRELQLDPVEVAGKRFHLGKGCPECHHTGHRGRQGIFEIMPFSDRLRQLMLEGASSDRLRAVAREEGMSTLRESGLVALFDGVTSVEEVLRATMVEA